VIDILAKNYNAKEVEGKWQHEWEKRGTHRFDVRNAKKVYSIDTPPPFTSGTLHMGHIYNHVWIDIVARYKRMRGFNVYLPQGFDCHGLPTELNVEKGFRISKDNREEFLAKCIEWTENAIKRMKSQFQSIGYSTDWDYSYRTMDDSYKKLVQKTLLIFYGKGLLYREKHPVLWCTRCGTALAKAEVGYVEKDGKLYHLDLESDGKKLTIATTRPEMMPACVAVFVHPDDARYKKFVGRKAKLPIFNREVPILEDSAVDMEFGTGVVYLCTFGDEQDIEWQKKYELPVVVAIDGNGRMTDVCGKYKGMKIEEARKKLVEDLENSGVIRKIEPLKHNVVCHTERESCKNPIELLPMEQWFIKVREFLDEIVETSRNMNWYPSYMLQRLVDWTESMNWDWIISRQRVFGTPIPFWVCGCGNVMPAKESELPVDPRGTTRKCSKCGKNGIGEKDVCDCWVDSSVTPLRIANWGVDENFFKKTYPATLRPQGYEIIRTWTFYTIFRNLILTGRGCFEDLMINGMIAGPDGRKMSKSLGNVISPEEPLMKYSADALRQWAAAGTLGDDYPFSWEECEHSQRFLTKLWNISRFMGMHLEDYKGEKGELTETDRWILSKLQRLVKTCTEDLDRYVFNTPLMQIRSFVWHELADDYLEMVKHRLYKPEIYGENSRKGAQYTLHTTLRTILGLLAPITPHICDEIWGETFKDGLATTSEWPEYDEKMINKDAESAGELARDVIVKIRKHKSENNLSLGSELENLTLQVNPKLKKTVEKVKDDIKGTGKVKNLRIGESNVESCNLLFSKGA